MPHNPKRRVLGEVNHQQPPQVASKHPHPHECASVRRGNTCFFTVPSRSNVPSAVAEEIDQTFNDVRIANKLFADTHLILLDSECESRFNIFRNSFSNKRMRNLLSILDQLVPDCHILLRLADFDSKFGIEVKGVPSGGIVGIKKLLSEQQVVQDALTGSRIATVDECDEWFKVLAAVGVISDLREGVSFPHVAALLGVDTDKVRVLFSYRSDVESDPSGTRIVHSKLSDHEVMYRRKSVAISLFSKAVFWLTNRLPRLPDTEAVVSILIRPVLHADRDKDWSNLTQLVDKFAPTMSVWRDIFLKDQIGIVPLLSSAKLGEGEKLARKIVACHSRSGVVKLGTKKDVIELTVSNDTTSVDCNTLISENLLFVWSARDLSDACSDAGGAVVRDFVKPNSAESADNVLRNNRRDRFGPTDSILPVVAEGNGVVSESLQTVEWRSAIVTARRFVNRTVTMVVRTNPRDHGEGGGEKILIKSTEFYVRYSLVLDPSLVRVDRAGFVEATHLEIRELNSRLMKLRESGAAVLRSVADGFLRKQRLVLRKAAAVVIGRWWKRVRPRGDVLGDEKLGSKNLRSIWAVLVENRREIEFLKFHNSTTSGPTYHNEYAEATLRASRAEADLARSQDAVREANNKVAMLEFQLAVQKDLVTNLNRRIASLSGKVEDVEEGEDDEAVARERLLAAENCSLKSVITQLERRLVRVERDAGSVPERIETRNQLILMLTYLVNLVRVGGDTTTATKQVHALISRLKDEV